MIQSLPEGNIAVLNLANNHALDQGEEGLTSTEQLLGELGIIHVGTGDDLDKAWEPRYITRNNITIAFIGASYTSYNDNGSGKSEKVARMQDTERLKKYVQEAK